MAIEDLGKGWRLFQLLAHLGEQAKSDFAAAAAERGLPPHLARVLMIIGEPIPMREVADHLACDPSTVTGLADGLEERGLAIRQPAEDRRIKLIALTPDGEELRQSIIASVAERSAVFQLSEAEREALDPLLSSLLASVRTSERSPMMRS